MSKEKIDIKDIKSMFAEYAKKELDFIESSDPDKLYHRILPNVKDKTRGSIDFLYKKIIVGGFIHEDTIYLNKLRVSKWGNDKDVEAVIAKIKETVEKGDMKLVNQLWYNKQIAGNLVALPDKCQHMDEIGLNPESSTKYKLSV